MFKQNGITFNDKSDAPHSQRFFSIEEFSNESIADQLDERFGFRMTEAKRTECEKLKAATIGGFYIFDDGSELEI